MTCRCVLLRHTLLDGDEHLDWFLERRPGEDRLLAFRLRDRPDQPGSVPAQQLPDHRRAYLDYEGPLSDGRGSVARLEAGVCQVVQPDPDTLRVRFRFRSRWFVAEGRRLEADSWGFSVQAGDPPAP